MSFYKKQRYVLHAMLVIMGVVFPTYLLADSDSKHSAPTVESLLTQVFNAGRHYSYSGLLTYEANGTLNTLRFSQYVDNSSTTQRVSQRLAFLDGVNRLATREQALTHCDTGKTRWGLWPSNFDINELKRFYHITLGAQVERIAERASYVMNLMPKDYFRYGYRFNIDKDTGLLLRSIIVEKQEVIERTQFISVNLQDQNVNTTVENDNAILWRVPAVEPCHTEQFQSAWSVGWLPDGFSSAGNRLTGKGEQVLMFTDGLVSISVFIVSNNDKRFPKVTARRGATSAVMTPLSFDTSKIVVVVGEIPKLTARRIAVSVKPQ